MNLEEARNDVPARLSAAEKHVARKELVRHLMDRRVPEKDEILQAKTLAKALAAASGDGGAEDFISSYLDLYLGRITGDPAVEGEALRACLSWIGRNERDGAQARQ